MALIREDAVPSAEGLAGGDHDGAALVARGDKLEEDAGLGVIFLDIGQVVEDQQVELVELGDVLGKREVLACRLQPLDEIRGSGEQHPVALLDERMAKCGRQVALSATGRAEGEDVVALGQPAVALGQGHDMGLAERWHGREVEAFERLAHGQACLPEMALDAAAITLGQLQLGQSGQEPGGRPPFTIGPVRERRPQVRKGRQTQRGQHQRQLGGIGGNLGRGTHAASSRAAKSAS